MWMGLGTQVLQMCLVLPLSGDLLKMCCSRRKAPERKARHPGGPAALDCAPRTGSEVARARASKCSKVGFVCRLWASSWLGQYEEVSRGSQWAELLLNKHHNRQLEAHTLPFLILGLHVPGHRVARFFLLRPLLAVETRSPPVPSCGRPCVSVSSSLLMRTLVTCDQGHPRTSLHLNHLPKGPISTQFHSEVWGYGFNMRICGGHSSAHNMY